MAIDVNEIPSARNFDRRFFIAIAILFPLAVLIGFGPTFYLKPFFDRPPVASSVVVVHGIVMTIWIALVFTQIFLIRTKRIKTHQKLGTMTAIFAVLVFGVGMMTGIEAAKRGASVPGIEPLPFLLVPVGDMLVFAVLLGAAIYYRKNAANHKRLILLTVLNFLPPVLGRFPFEAAGTPPFFYGAPGILALAFVAIDTWRNGKLNKVFLFGALFMIAAQWVRLFVMNSDVWVGVAKWLTS